MIEVQMGIDDDVDVLRTHAAGRKIVEQLRRLAVNLHHLFRQLVADPSLDENVLFAGANEQRIEPGDDEIFLIRDQLARPHDLGHDSEERSSVERIGSVREYAQLKIAQCHLVHCIPPTSVRVRNVPRSSGTDECAPTFPQCRASC